MRTISAAKQAVIDGDSKGYRLKVEVQDSGLVFRDLSTYPGFDAVLSVTIDENIDNPVATASVSLMRELDGLSIAPLVTSGPNNGFNPAASVSALLKIANEIKISVAVVPEDREPVSGDYELLFYGIIDSIDVADFEVKLECRDLAARIVDTFIEKERIYAANQAGTPVKGIRIWYPGEQWALNDFVTPTEANRAIGAGGNGVYFKCITAGTAGTSEPTWTTLANTNDGTAVWTAEALLNTTGGFKVEDVMQAILNENGLSAFTLYTPVSPGWNILVYKQDRTSCFEAIHALAVQIGWDIRWKWDDGTSAFRLTFYDPNRTKTTADYTFTSDDYEQLTEVAVNKQDIRNVIQVVYNDRSTLLPLGESGRKIVVVSDSASITKYGRLFFEITEDATSNIDSSSEATALANAALADLKEPLISHAADLAYGFPWAQINDLFQFDANGRHYSSNQKVACVAISHSFTDGAMTTRLHCRGQPTAGVEVWSSLGVTTVEEFRGANIQALPSDIAATENGITMASEPTPGGARIFYQYTALTKYVELEFETHVSTSSSFTPSLSTLVQRGPSSKVELSQLNPGATYYVKNVPFYRMGGKIIRGQPSASYSFVAGRAVTGHLPSDVQYWRQPLNGNLDNAFDRDTRKNELPDHWNLKTGTLGTEVVSKYDSTAGVGNAVSGRYYLRFSTSSSTGAVESDSMIIEGGKRYKLTVLAKNSSGTGSWSAKANFLKFDKTSQSVETFSQSVTADVGSWVDRTWYITTPDAARYATIEIGTATSSTQSFDVDSVKWEEVPEIARYFHDPGAGAQSIPNATNTTIDFSDAFDSQTNANVTTGAAWKYTAPRQGYYLLQTAISMVFNNNDNGTFYVEVWKNGAAHRRIIRHSGHTLREETQYMGSCMLYLAKGDYVHVNVYQTTGGARNVENGSQTFVEIIQVA